MKRIGILAYSAEGAGMCFLAACHEGERRLGAHFHPDIVLDIEAMGTSLEDWDRHDFPPIAERFHHQAERLAAAGCDFWICPDNTAHMAFEAMQAPLPIPGLHIAEVAADEAKHRGFKNIALTGTRWTMAGPVYPAALGRRNLDFAVPNEDDRDVIQAIIMDELVHGTVNADSRARFAAIVGKMKAEDCDAVVLGCTELPMLLDDTTSPLPVLDSTRLLARAAVDVALGARPMPSWRGGPLD
jgi:aspartate racemase